MRHAKCINDLKLMLQGNKGSVAIAKGWQGDLDQVLGERVIPEKRDPENPAKVLEPERRVDETIADQLGHHLTEANFELAAAAGKKGPVSTAAGAKPQSEE